jgi:hypothetical protein
VGERREVERVIPLLGVPKGGVPRDLRYGLFLERRLLVEVRTEAEALLVGVVGVGVCCGRKEVPGPSSSDGWGAERGSIRYSVA